MTADPSDRESSSTEGSDPEDAAPREEEHQEEPNRDEGAGTPGDDADEGDEDEGRRPISVRDLMPSPSSRPSRRSPGPKERGAPPAETEEAEGPLGEEETEKAAAGAEADAGAEQEAPQAAASVPTPVRVAMDAPPPGDSRPPEELPSRRFELDGEEWIVRITGRTITGTRPDPGALLMHLSFFRPEEPEAPVRRLVTVDRPLDALYQEDLAELFGRSRPPERKGPAGAEG